MDLAFASGLFITGFIAGGLVVWLIARDELRRWRHVVSRPKPMLDFEGQCAGQIGWAAFSTGAAWKLIHAGKISECKAELVTQLASTYKFARIMKDVDPKYGRILLFLDSLCDESDMLKGVKDVSIDSSGTKKRWCRICK